MKQHTDLRSNKLLNLCDGFMFGQENPTAPDGIDGLRTNIKGCPEGRSSFGSGFPIGASSIPVGTQFSAGKSREPLNNSLCPVSARCISRNLHLVKVISVQNGHYFSAFLLLFLKKGRLPLYQVAESFRPAMASAYKLAQANIAYSRFSFFFRPRYTVFL